jgi:hypothetical protein
MNLNVTQIKLLLALVLFATWIALVVFNVSNAADLIGYIKFALSGLGVHTLTMIRPGGAIASVQGLAMDELQSLPLPPQPAVVTTPISQ